MPHAEPTPLALHPFKGLGQTVAALFLALLVTGICWCGWAYISHRRLAAEIAAIAALHQPFWESDYPTTNIPDAQNGAPLWRAVFAALSPNDPCPANNNFSFNGYPPFPPQWHQLEDQSIAANANMFVLVHRAAAMEVDWGEAARSQASPFPYFSPSRGIANVLGDAILDAHLRGDDALAVQRARDLIQLGRADGGIKSLIGRLVALGIQALCNDRLMCITPDLVIENDPTNRAAQGASAVSRAAVQSLIHTLLDESNDTQNRTEAIDWERTYAHQNFRALRKPLFALGPLIDLSEARTLIQRKVDRLAVAAPSESAATIIYQSNPTRPLGSGATGFGQPKNPPGSSPRWAGVYEDPFSWSFSRYVHVEWIRSADCRCAAIALAIRLYRVDHQGDWPATLAELVPIYLPAVPADPFAPTPSPIGYIIRKHATPAGGDRPVLYFALVGNPAKVPLPPIPNFDWTQTNGQWRDISRWYPVIPAIPATSASSP
jgi:hypothetical protein